MPKKPSKKKLKKPKRKRKFPSPKKGKDDFIHPDPVTYPNILEPGKETRLLHTYDTVEEIATKLQGTVERVRVGEENVTTGCTVRFVVGKDQGRDPKNAVAR
jgi:hypothetical protein